VVCSSTRRTDEKHMLYLQLLEETFVRQLHESGCSFKGLFNPSPRYCRCMKSSKQTVKYIAPDQVYKQRLYSLITRQKMEGNSCNIFFCMMQKGCSIMQPGKPPS
jgi:hypothetical protein